MKNNAIFDPLVLRDLAQKHKSTLERLWTIELELTRLFSNMDRAIRALVLSAATGEALLFIGPPGTGKSQLIRVFCDHLGIPVTDSSKERPEAYFEYLLTAFTEPGELFGYYDILAATQNKLLKRSEKGQLQKAKVVYLDEVFNASSAILNSLLSIMQEKRFHDGNSWVDTPWKCFFGATNTLPKVETLRAFFDRYLLRCWVENVSTDSDIQNGVNHVKNLLDTGWKLTYGYNAPENQKTTLTSQSLLPGIPNLLAELSRFQEDIKANVRNGRLKINLESTFYQTLTLVIKTIRDEQLSDFSNRRLVKMLYVMMVHAIYNAICFNLRLDNIEIGSEELKLLEAYAVDRRDPFSKKKIDQAIDRIQG